MWDKSGGVRGVAKRLGVARSTVYKWKEAGHIPERHLPALERELGLSRRELTMRDAA